MEKREDALREALEANAQETERWTKYMKENETAIENLNMFAKSVRVDVMVPIGSVALMPGQLIHTNEVLVGHYQGYFSECSAQNAKEICEHRIKKAQDHLKKLETEAELWQNKLDKPYTEGVLPSGEEREIIEEYDEEKDRLWREQHKINMKLEKMIEKEQRTNGTEDKSDEEIFRMLEEAEMMEEMQKELENLEVEEIDDEMLRKLMSGEMKLPEKSSRTAHNGHPTEEVPMQSTALSGVVKKTEIVESNATPTNNNVRPNPDFVGIDNDIGDNECDDGQSEASHHSDSDDEMIEEVRHIKEQAQFLSPVDRAEFYTYQIEIVLKRLKQIKLTDQKDLEEKVKLYTMVDQLITAQESLGIDDDNEDIAEGEPVEAADAVESSEGNVGDDAETQSAKLKKPKRRISFALEDQTLEFRNNESVAHMMAERRDDRKEKMLENITQGQEFMSENQSTKDFDLLNEILASAENKAKTLNIKFQHSSQPGVRKSIVGESTEFVPMSPADCLFLIGKDIQTAKSDMPSTVFWHGYEGEDQVVSPFLREVDRQSAYEDPKAEFSLPTTENLQQEEELPTQPKSILRNKAAVVNETQLENEENRPVNGNAMLSTKRPKKKREIFDRSDPADEYMTAYSQVMSDVVEKTLSEPEPLPSGKFIDARTPKKRVSRFKQMRQGQAQEQHD